MHFCTPSKPAFVGYVFSDYRCTFIFLVVFILKVLQNQSLNSTGAIKLRVEVVFFLCWVYSSVKSTALITVIWDAKLQGAEHFRQKL